ncbi:MAG: hypothetical protein AAF214_00645 [Pseudomonadota bacterium]
MRKTIQSAVVCAVTGLPVAAQDTTQQSVVGASGNPIYSVQVVGQNGVTYNCLPDLQRIESQLVRRCQRLNAAGGTSNGLLGGSLSTGLAAGAVAFVLVAVAAGSDGSTATTTN